VTSIQRHIVRREVLDVHVVGTEADGLTVQRRVAELCRDWLAPALDDAFAGVVPDGEIWSVDRLEVDAGTFDIAHLERDFAGAVAKAVAGRMRERSAGLGGGVQRGLPEAAKAMPSAQEQSLATPGMALAATDDVFRRRSDSQAAQEALLYFLATGLLPWWFSLPGGTTLEDAVVAAWRRARPPQEFARRIVHGIRSAVMRTRLVRQFSENLLRSLVEEAAPEVARAVGQIQTALEKLEHAPEEVASFSQALWQAALASAASGEHSAVEVCTERLLRGISEAANGGEGRLAAAIARTMAAPTSGRGSRKLSTADRRIKSSAAGPSRAAGPAPFTGSAAAGPASSTGSATADQPSQTPEPDRPEGALAQAALEEGIFVDCAGVVLLHPFLPLLFETLGIAKDGDVIAPERALCLLHFLATGERRAPEYALVVAKLLCGLPLESPSPAPVMLRADEEEEAAALLKSAIGHWDALGDISIDTLRGTFLVRPGKLTLRADGDAVLQLEKQSFDVLLDRLPWSISAIRLPWMKAMLWVEWQA